MSAQPAGTMPWTLRPPLRLHARSAAALLLASAVGLLAFGWPLVVDPGSGLAHSGDAVWLFALLLPVLLAVALAELSEGGIDAKAVALLGVLTALTAALRPLGGGVTGFQPMFVVLVLAGRVFGPGFGFLLGSTSMLASALVTGGVGPWLPFQMLAAGWVGMAAGLLPEARGRAEVALLTGYAGLAGLGYGILMNLWSWPYLTGLAGGLAYQPGAPLAENLGRFLAYSLATSLGWDVPRAVTMVVLVAVLGRSALGVLRRTARRAAFDAPAAFLPEGTA